MKLLMLVSIMSSYECLKQEIERLNIRGVVNTKCWRKGNDSIKICYLRAHFPANWTVQCDGEGKLRSRYRDEHMDTLRWTEVPTCTSNLHKIKTAKKKKNCTHDASGATESQQIFKEITPGVGNCTITVCPCDIRESKETKTTDEGNAITAKHIFNGDDVHETEFPYYVSLHMGTPDVGSSWVWCGATLITDSWLLTAAHCFDVVTFHFLTLNDGTTSSDFEYFIHPRYNHSGNYENDIALIKMKKSVDFSSRVSPICLPLYHNDYQPNDTMITIGKGFKDPDNSQPNIFPKSHTSLRKAIVSYIDNKECRSHMGPDDHLTANQMCTIGVSEKGTCEMDSGGPLIVKDPRTGRDVLAGVIQGGFGYCNVPDVTDYYARVSKYIGWIQSVTNISFC